MPLVPGTTVGEGLDSTQRRINLAPSRGGSVASGVRGGLDLRFGSLAVRAASADVEVILTNSAVGHSAPGGLSSKSLVLAVGIDTGSGELANRKERVYRRELKDAEGHALATVPDLFLKAASVGEDTRIKQKESRSEPFTMPLPESWKAIVARLEDHDASEPEAPKTMSLSERAARARPLRPCTSGTAHRVRSQANATSANLSPVILTFVSAGSERVGGSLAHLKEPPASDALQGEVRPFPLPRPRPGRLRHPARAEPVGATPAGE